MLKKHTYLSVIVGAGLLMLLRVCDKASILSALIVTIGLTALIYSVRHAQSKKEYILIAGAMAVTFAVRCYGYTGDPVSDLALGPLIGLIMFALMGVECLLKKFRDSFLYTLIFPVLYLLFMYSTEIIKINMPFRMDTYLSCIPVLCQITSVFGIYCLDFLLAWTASVIVYIVDCVGQSGRSGRLGRGRFGQSGKSLIPVAGYVAVMCGVICFGTVHLHEMNAVESAKQDTVRVACATGPYVGKMSDGSFQKLTLNECLESFNGIVKDAAEENAEILVFSEEAYGVSDQDEETLLDSAKKMASKYNMHLLLAYETADTDDSEGGKGENKLCWISNEGKTLYNYTKHCLVPVVETSEYVRGDKNIEAFDIDVHGKTLRVATAICYDADFDLFMSHMGDDVDLLLLPTWDWDVIAEEHFGVARLRAISSGTTLVRSVYDGWSAVIDGAGNVVSRENSNEFGYEKVWVNEVPIP